MPEDRPRQLVIEVSALNADFSSLSVDLLGLKRLAHENIKEGYLSTRCFIKRTPFCFFIIYSNDEQFA